MLKWFWSLKTSTKIIIILQFLFFWGSITSIIIMNSYFDIFKELQEIIIDKSDGLYIVILILLIMCLFIFILRIIFILYFYFFQRKKFIENKIEDFSEENIYYFTLVNIFIEESYDNNWYYPIIVSFYITYLFYLEIIFFSLLTIFGPCLENNKYDKLTYYKKYSFSYKSKSLNRNIGF